MTACSGDGCNHESHQLGEKQERQDERLTKVAVEPKRERRQLTKNQKKARRRKGFPGY